MGCLIGSVVLGLFMFLLACLCLFDLRLFVICFWFEFGRSWLVVCFARGFWWLWTICGLFISDFL